MVKQVEQYDQSCDVCQKIKSSGKYKQAEKKIITPCHTNHIFGTDYVIDYVKLLSEVIEIYYLILLSINDD